MQGRHRLVNCLHLVEAGRPTPEVVDMEAFEMGVEAVIRAVEVVVTEVAEHLSVVGHLIGDAHDLVHVRDHDHGIESVMVVEVVGGIDLRATRKVLLNEVVDQEVRIAAVKRKTAAEVEVLTKKTDHPKIETKRMMIKTGAEVEAKVEVKVEAGVAVHTKKTDHPKIETKLMMVKAGAEVEAKVEVKVEAGVAVHTKKTDHPKIEKRLMMAKTEAEVEVKVEAGVEVLTKKTDHPKTEKKETKLMMEIVKMRNGQLKMIMIIMMMLISNLMLIKMIMLHLRCKHKDNKKSNNDQMMTTTPFCNTNLDSKCDQQLNKYI